MIEEPLWIDRDELHLLYARQVELFGGSFGVRDENMVESALHRPRMKFNYEAEADLFDLAAAYLIGFTKNHGFVDGNKRIGLAATLSFLGVNGWRIVTSSGELLNLVLGAATWPPGCAIVRGHEDDPTRGDTEGTEMSVLRALRVSV